MIRWLIAIISHFKPGYNGIQKPGMGQKRGQNYAPTRHYQPSSMPGSGSHEDNWEPFNTWDPAEDVPEDERESFRTLPDVPDEFYRPLSRHWARPHNNNNEVHQWPTAPMLKQILT